MGCVQNREEDTPEAAELRSSAQREVLAELPEKQLRKRLRELGSKLSLDKSELLDWVLFRNALCLIFGADDTKVGQGLKAIKELQLDKDSVVAALVSLKNFRDKADKDDFRKWAGSLELEESRELLRKTISRRTLMRSARGFLSFGGNLLLRAIMREWRRICVSSNAWKADDTDDFDIGDEGPRMLGEGREQVFSRDPDDEKSRSLHTPETTVFSVPEAQVDAAVLPEPLPDAGDQGTYSEAQHKEPEVSNRPPPGIHRNTWDDRIDDNDRKPALSTADVMLRDQDVVPNSSQLPPKQTASPGPSTSDSPTPQKQTRSRASKSSNSEFDMLDEELSTMLEDKVFDNLNSRLSNQKSQPIVQKGNAPMTNFMQDVAVR